MNPQDVGQLLCVGFPGTALPSSMRRRLSDGRAGGAILFADNVSLDPLETATLCADIGRAAGDLPAPLVAVDQEGGRVARVRLPATEWPPMAVLGRIGSETIARNVGQAIAHELSVLGFNVDFAPVLDVATNPANPVIGDRALATDPHEVARLGVAMAQGIEARGVASCGKHFPGHGDTSKDSHLELPVLSHDLERLRRVELVPFVAAARVGVAMIMTAHVLFPALDPRYPATLSEKVLGLLRGELGYRGVIVSDDLEMKAVADAYPIEELLRLGLLAGCDLFLVCHDEAREQAAFEALVGLAEAGGRTAERIAESVARVSALKQRFARKGFVPDPARIHTTLSAPTHRALSVRLFEAWHG